MIRLLNDYSAGAHPQILEAMVRTNEIPAEAYGMDEYCTRATEYIRKKAETDAEVFFVSGGTQCNLLCIAHGLRPYEAVISSHLGHIHGHEAGSIEATGHKILTVRSKDGKISAEQVRKTCEQNPAEDDHMVVPAMVYISNPTELGTVYSKQELEELRKVCDAFGLLLFMDGARLASALTAKEGDASLADIAALCDAFYIGGTKCGALIGEALVVPNKSCARHMRHSMKQRGVILAKGRVLGIQFEQLFQEDLYWQNGAHANRLADILRAGITSLGYSLRVQSGTNQVFPVLPNHIVAALQKEVAFAVWEAGEQTSVIRLVTAWSTQEQEVHDFITALSKVTLACKGSMN